MQGKRTGTELRNSYYPFARTEDLIRTEANSEVLVYDSRSHHIHHLDEECTNVWNHSNGKRTPDAISMVTGIHQDRVHIALRELDDRNLLVDRLPVMVDQPTLSRRRLATLSVGALPTIISVSAPIAASATSHSKPACNDRYGACNTDADCCPSPYEDFYSYCLGGFGGYCEIQRKDQP